MPRFSWLLVSLILTAGSARGNDAKPATPDSPSRTLLAAANEVKERALAEMIRDYQKLEAEQLPDAEKFPKQKAIYDRFQSASIPTFDGLLGAASDHPEDPASVEALGYVVSNGRGLGTEQSKRALALLRRDHVRTPSITTATRMLFLQPYQPEATALLRAVIADNPSRTECGRACLDLAYLLHSYLAADVGRDDRAALKAEEESLYDRCVAEFADVTVGGYGTDKTVGDYAQGALIEFRQLQVGQVAPEIIGQDVDGKPLRLSDSRGKVVVLTFSGEWCPPCRANAKFFRDLLKPQAQEATPCVILEVNTDETRDPLRKALGAGDITWPCWFDGGLTGPITVAWGVRSFPTIYVLDAQGVIRAKDIRGEATAAAVAKVLKTQTVGK